MPSVMHVKSACLVALVEMFTDLHLAQKVTSDEPMNSAQDLKLRTLLNAIKDHQFSGEPLGMLDIQGLELRLSDWITLLRPRDAELATNLLSLLSQLDSISSFNDAKIPLQTVSDTNDANVYQNLRCQLEDLRSRGNGPYSPAPADVVQSHIMEPTFLNEIISTLDTVQILCNYNYRTRSVQYAESIPPDYELPSPSRSTFDLEAPPQYRKNSDRHIIDSKQHLQPSQESYSEKMRLDLESVARAIDRLHRAAPQLHDQRAELRFSKISNGLKTKKLGKQKAIEPGPDDLNHILDLVGKASERKMFDQVVLVEGGMNARLDEARRKEQNQVCAFTADILRQTHAYQPT